MRKNMNDTLNNLNNLILKNPFRILGLCVNASKRDIERQSSRLKKYLLAGQEPPADFSFLPLDNYIRQAQEASICSQQLTADDDRLKYGLFWFWNKYPITDEPAFEYLKSAKTDEAACVWAKMVFNNFPEFKEVSVRNISAFHNLSVLKLLQAACSKEADKAYEALRMAVKIRLTLLESPFWSLFKEDITDKTYIVSQEETQLIFLNTLLKKEDIDTVFNSWPLFPFGHNLFKAGGSFLNSVLSGYEEQIKENKTLLENILKNNEDAFPKAAEDFISDAQTVLGKAKVFQDDFQREEFSDKIASILLNNVYDYFNNQAEAYKEGNDDSFVKKSIAIVDKAESFAKDTNTLSRCDNFRSYMKSFLYKDGYIMVNTLDLVLKKCQSIDTFFNRLGGVTVNRDTVAKALRDLITDKAILQLVSCGDKAQVNRFLDILSKLGAYAYVGEYRSKFNRIKKVYDCKQVLGKYRKGTSARIKAFFKFIADKGFENLSKVADNELSRENWEKMVKNEPDKIESVYTFITVDLIDSIPSGLVSDSEDILYDLLPESHKVKQSIETKRANARIYKGIGCTVILLIIMLLIFMGIAAAKQNQEDAYKRTVNSNNISVYKDFLKSYPGSKYYGEVSDKMNILIAEDDKRWKELSAKQDYDTYLKENPYGLHRTEARQLQAAAAKEQEKQDWAVLSGNKKYEDYLKKYPGGMFSEEAKKLLENELWSTDKSAWDTAKKRHTKESYNKYLAMYSGGKYKRDAQKGLLDIKVSEHFAKSAGTLPAPSYDFSYWGYKSKSGNKAKIEIENDNDKTMYMLFSGPEGKEITINPRKRVTVKLEPGEYRVVGFLDDSGSFTNKINFSEGSYSASYHLVTTYVPSYTYGTRRRY